MAEQKNAPSKPEPQKKEVVTIRAVFGDMVDVTTNARYTKEPVEVLMNWWIKIQVEAGKLEVVNG